ncbi:MAG: FAD-binding oxidoreductase [Micrococcales bacterium]|nr:FAD-binding oxidoreductase [Micrococcales bacterium]
MPDAPARLTPGVPLWSAPQPSRPALEGDLTVDIAVVGAGYTGLWAAYYLAKADPRLRIAVIEREHVGFGASGRNGGWASAIFPISLQHVARGSSHAAALALQQAMNDSVDEIGRVCAAEDIDAHFAKEGFISLARSRAQLARARAAATASGAFGLPDQLRLVGQREAAERVGATDVMGGLATDHCALIHPGRLVRGLAQVVESLGVTVYERTPVESATGRDLRTPHGTVRAEVVIRATEGFTPQFREHRRTLVPLYSLVLATEPLPAELLERLRLRHRTAFNDLRHLRIYAQVTQDGRVVFGGRGAPYHFGSAVAPEFDSVAAIHRSIHATMLELFPALRGVRVTHRWGGPLGVPRDWHPSVGLDRATGVAWAGPYVGDGVTTSNLAGRVLRDLILEQDTPERGLPIVNHHSPRWEPEPLRWLGVNLGLRAAALGDAEERVTGQPSRVAGPLESLTGAH